MKKIIMIITAGAIVLSSCGEKKTITEEFKGLANEADSLSYFMGVISAKNIKSNKVDKLFSATAFDKGLRDGLLEVDPMINREMGMKLFQDNGEKIMKDTSVLVLEKIDIQEFKSLANLNDSITYLFGQDAGKILFENGFDKYYADKAFYKGIEDELKGNALVLAEKDGDELARKIAETEKENVAAKKKTKYKDVIEEGEAFLQEKSKLADVVTLPSGLRYKILTEGDGPKPILTDVVTVHYKGSFIDGTVFESSYVKGQPIDNPVTQFIAGWTEALQLMPIGSKWELYIPYDLAYGSRQNGPKIGPFSTLVFEVELLGVKDADEMMKQQQMQQQIQQQLQQQMQQQQGAQ